MNAAGQTETKPVEDFVEVRPVIMEGFLDAKNVFFVVGMQSFCITPHGTETASDAVWMKQQFCHALRAFIKAAATDLHEAARLQEAAELAHANCAECGGEGVPELCPECFPLFDEARLKRRAALAKPDA